MEPVSPFGTVPKGETGSVVKCVFALAQRLKSGFDLRLKVDALSAFECRWCLFE